MGVAGAAESRPVVAQIWDKSSGFCSTKLLTQGKCSGHSPGRVFAQRIGKMLRIELPADAEDVEVENERIRYKLMAARFLLDCDLCFLAIRVCSCPQFF